MLQKANSIYRVHSGGQIPPHSIFFVQDTLFARAARKKFIDTQRSPTLNRITVYTDSMIEIDTKSGLTVYVLWRILFSATLRAKSNSDVALYTLTGNFMQCIALYNTLCARTESQPSRHIFSPTHPLKPPPDPTISTKSTTGYPTTQGPAP
jgi:hypothetical protein